MGAARQRPGSAASQTPIPWAVPGSEDLSLAELQGRIADLTHCQGPGAPAGLTGATRTPSENLRSCRVFQGSPGRGRSALPCGRKTLPQLRFRASLDSNHGPSESVAAAVRLATPRSREGFPTASQVSGEQSHYKAFLAGHSDGGASWEHKKATMQYKSDTVNSEAPKSHFQPSPSTLWPGSNGHKAKSRRITGVGVGELGLPRSLGHVRRGRP